MVKVEWRTIREKQRTDALSTRRSYHVAQHVVIFSTLLSLAVAQSPTTAPINQSTPDPVFTVVRANDVYDQDTGAGFTGVT